MKFFNFIKEYKLLKYLAFHDNLTGLLNRNYLYHKLDKSKYNYVYFIDINDLTEINNEFGHTTGDSHIKYCVAEMSKYISKGDCFIRYAGDEFLIFSNLMLPIKTNKLFSVGESIVISTEIMDSINNADKQMIKEKQLWKLMTN